MFAAAFIVKPRASAGGENGVKLLRAPIERDAVRGALGTFDFGLSAVIPQSQVENPFLAMVLFPLSKIRASNGRFKRT
jgi:hypothetical protein